MQERRRSRNCILQDGSHFVITNFFKRECKSMAFLIGATLVYSLSIWVFVSPANFAPSGIMGVAMMLKFATGLNEGIYSLALNVPLIVIAWFFLNKRYVIYTLVYTAISSVLIILYEQFGLYQLNGYELMSVLPPIFGGILQGLSMGFMFKIGASTGGTDVIGAMLQKKYRHINIERIISLCCYVVVAMSYFVFGNLTSVLMSIIHIFVVEKTISSMLKSGRNAVNFTIITDKPEEIGRAIVFELRHGATMVESKGVFSGENKNMLICIVNYSQIPALFSIIDRFPGSFAYYSDVMGVKGKFTRDKEDPEDTARRIERLKGE